METIVILTKQYLNKPTANGICASNIVSGLKKMGNRVHVISCEQEGCFPSDDITPFLENSHSVFDRGRTQAIVSRFFRILKIMLGVKSTIWKKKLVSLYVDHLQAYNEMHPIDRIVAIYYPNESFQAASIYKKMHPKVKVTAYELDSFGDGIKQSELARYNSLYHKWISGLYLSFDSIIVMNSHAKYWEKEFGKIAGQKLRISDIPVLTHHMTVNRKENENCIMIYSGLIEKKYRSPTYLLSVLRNLSTVMQFEFYFYSKGDCEEEIAEAAKTVSAIKQVGYVSKDVLDVATSQATILVSIGNSNSRSVPSKLIYYMSFGKPILHFSSQRDDVCKEYLEKYPLALVIDESTDARSASLQIKEFVDRVDGQTVDYDTVSELFYMNDPQYSAKLIVE